MIAKEELNILWSLEQTAEKYEDRVAVSDVNQELTWKGLVKKAQVIGAELSKKVQPGNPIPVLLEKSSETLAVMLGIVYAGCFYVPVNPMNPAERLRKIMEKLEPEVIISDEKGKEQLAAVGVGLEEKVIGPEILHRQQERICQKNSAVDWNRSRDNGKRQMLCMEFSPPDLQELRRRL